MFRFTNSSQPVASSSNAPSLLSNHVQANSAANYSGNPASIADHTSTSGSEGMGRLRTASYASLITNSSSGEELEEDFLSENEKQAIPPKHRDQRHFFNTHSGTASVFVPPSPHTEPEAPEEGSEQEDDDWSVAEIETKALPTKYRYNGKKQYILRTESAAFVAERMVTRPTGSSASSVRVPTVDEPTATPLASSSDSGDATGRPPLSVTIVHNQEAQAVQPEPLKKVRLTDPEPDANTGQDAGLQARATTRAQKKRATEPQLQPEEPQASKGPRTTTRASKRTAPSKVQPEQVRTSSLPETVPRASKRTLEAEVQPDSEEAQTSKGARRTTRAASKRAAAGVVQPVAAKASRVVRMVAPAADIEVQAQAEVGPDAPEPKRRRSARGANSVKPQPNYKV
ncbi:hypothetical protein FA15DRAFT_655835 [Coprinopsis marcescibilis]|uniref:Uncharacterized protein n=1 Tax=Coprinopsis marcescibilis TaxID=230819 RepID=A0A5C3KV30_COPMA|nr:hypothetical protein FA15DRAFT_655835 [Coprinopsis marcescibilis]